MPLGSTAISPRARTALAVLAVFLVALGIRLVGAADRPMQVDEYYTIFAARSYAAEGVPRIAAGEYTRAPQFTALVATTMSSFGDSVFVARLPSIVASALVVMLAFLWLRRAAGSAAAWLLALWLALSAAALEVAQFARFYALHGLLFLVCALALYELLDDRRAAMWVGFRRWGAALLAAVGALAAFAALQLQVTTAIGLVGLASWAVAVLASRRTVRALLHQRLPWPVLLLTVAGVLIAAVLVDLPDRLATLYGQYRWAAMWALEDRDRPMFFVHALARQLPLFAYTFPVAVAVALARAPRPAFFCLVVCAVALLLHSFAGMKTLRYIHYLWPLLLAPWAIAGAVLLRAVAEAAARGWERLTDGLRGLRRLDPAAVAAAAVVAAIAFALAGNPDTRTVSALPGDVASALGVGAWGAAARERTREMQRSIAAIRDVAGSPGLLVTSNDLLAMWHLGRSALEMRAGRLYEIHPGGEFARDPRTGGIIISRPKSLERVMKCYPTGTVVIWPGDWRHKIKVPAATADFIEARMVEVPLAGRDGARVFRWSEAPSGDTSCVSLFARSGKATVGYSGQ